MRTLNFKLWEIIIILFSIIIFIFSYLGFSTNFPLIKSILNIGENDKQVLIGHIVSKDGSIKRRKSNQNEFNAIDSLSPLYNMDMIVTGPHSSASIYFDGGSSAELGAQTMVRLAFPQHTTLSQIRRQPSGRLEVVAGKVIGQAGKQKLLITSGDQVITVNANTAKRVDVQDPSSSPKINSVPLVAEEVESKPIEAPDPKALAIAANRSTPTPTPSPVFKRDLSQIKVIYPLHQKFKLDPSSTLLEKEISLKWSMSPPDGETQVVVRKLANGDIPLKRNGKEVFKVQSSAQLGSGSAVFKIQSPGNYEWEIRGPQGESLSNPESTTGSFELDPLIECIRPLNPLVGGKSMTSNQLTEELLSHFEITLRWAKPAYPDIDNYDLAFLKAPNSPKPFLEKQTKKPEFVFSRDKAFHGNFHYIVTAKLNNGFELTSGLQSFTFAFLPPVLVMPSDRAVITKEMLLHENNRITLTWQKTNFTENYEIEISQDPAFSRTKTKLRMEDNFYEFENPAPGRYYWRVQSLSKDISSAMSPVSTFTVERSGT